MTAAIMTQTAKYFPAMTLIFSNTFIFLDLKDYSGLQHVSTVALIDKLPHVLLVDIFVSPHLLHVLQYKFHLYLVHALLIFHYMNLLYLFHPDYPYLSLIVRGNYHLQHDLRFHLLYSFYSILLLQIKSHYQVQRLAHKHLLPLVFSLDNHEYKNKLIDVAPPIVLTAPHDRPQK